MTESQEIPEGLSTAELLARLSEQTAELVRDELRLAQAELRSKASDAGLGIGMFGASGLLVFFGIAALITTAIAALSLVLPVWLAALIVTAALFLIAGGAALLGRSKVKSVGSVTPRRTLDSVKQDVSEIKESTHHEHR